MTHCLPEPYFGHISFWEDRYEYRIKEEWLLRGRGLSISLAVSKSNCWCYFQLWESKLVMSNLFPSISLRNGIISWVLWWGREDSSRLFPETGKNRLQENLIIGLHLGVFQLVGLSERCCDDRNIILKTDWNLALKGAFHSLDRAKQLATQSATQLPFLG